MIISSKVEIEHVVEDLEQVGPALGGVLVQSDVLVEHLRGKYQAIISSRLRVGVRDVGTLRNLISWRSYMGRDFRGFIFAVAFGRHWE